MKETSYLYQILSDSGLPKVDDTYHEFWSEHHELNIFTDFKRLNETYFWSESRQVFLSQYDLQSDKYFNQDFVFPDEVRCHFMKIDTYKQVQ